MRDGRGRRLVKYVARSLFRFDLAVARRWQGARRQTPHVLAGECQRCAACCETPAIQVGRLVWYLRSLRAGFLWWQRAVNGFELVRDDRLAMVFVFRCTHFDGATRSCDSYDSRPGMCRDYPRALLHQNDPDFFPSCGYRAVARGAPRLLAELERQPMSDEQRATLGRRLRLL